jgi:hypothetical protein
VPPPDVPPERLQPGVVTDEQQSRHVK